MKSKNTKIYHPLFDGFLTGFLLQIAIGPVFFFILNISIRRSFIDGIVAVSAVTLADYIYITFAILGTGSLLDHKKVKMFFSLICPAILILFGIYIILNSIMIQNHEILESYQSRNYMASFWSAFFITISNPLTIVFWTGMFATKAIEKGYSKNNLFPFGIGAGMATFTFLSFSITILYFFKTSLPNNIIDYINIAVGIIISLYGITRLLKNLKTTIEK